jgi:hypothetical protein
MSTFFVRTVAVDIEQALPDRVADKGLWELVDAFGGPRDGDDVWEALRACFEPLSLADLGEKLLDLILLQPPIPAGCAALMEQMKDPDNPPWDTHEVASDRFWLWYAHHVVHRAQPDRLPAPPIARVTTAVTMTEPASRPPGPRTSPRDRTRFMAALLAARVGDNPLAAAATEDDWAFDAIWHVRVDGRHRATDEELAAAGVTGDRLFTVAFSTWCAPRWVGDLAAGLAWRGDA